ncbi:hypothetical protein DKT77_12675 [Meridianimarinicoccus roseus]|uniref:Uncharacterized protein n=1 Tax=Meridianimarinicoccus roseus TaxID=2072018 RepID=A0A2V2LFV1_9RHOB|nr:hypothetical protein [Meridianimarinicoccus roseus]PWR02384.1 hypothetical protein DKT77_12675 [Meridianimarinicoccus roseus]
MSRSRALSAIEAVTNVVVGYGVAVAAQLVFFPAIGISVALADNLRLGALFTGLSLVRSYVLRRLFARIGRRAPGGTGGGPCRASRSS